MRRFAVLLAAAASLSGCTTLAGSLSHFPVTPAEIKAAVECELAYLFLDGAPDPRLISRATAAAELTLSLTDAASLTPGLTVKGKIGPATLSLPASMTASSSRNGTITLAFDILRVGEMAGRSCPQPESDTAATGLGLTAWLTRVLETVSPLADGDRIKDMKYTVSFTVTRTAKGGLSFTSQFLDISLSENSASRSEVNKLEIKFEVPSGGAGRKQVARELHRQLTEERNAPALIQVLPGQTVTIQ